MFASQVSVRTGNLHDLQRMMEVKSDAYGARGYCSEGGRTVLEEGKEFALVAEEQGELVGTLLVTVDTFRKDGKPLPVVDKIFPVEVARIREASTCLAYYGSFAVKKDRWRAGLTSVGLPLICAAIRRASEDGVDAAVIVVNPDDVRFYLFLGFEVVAECDDIPELAEEGKVPGVLMTVTRETFHEGFVREESDLRVRRIRKAASS